MGDRVCDRERCFYCAEGRCFNIAVSVVDQCELFLDNDMHRSIRPGKMKKPAIPTHAKAERAAS